MYELKLYSLWQLRFLLYFWGHVAASHSFNLHTFVYRNVQTHVFFLAWILIRFLNYSFRYLLYTLDNELIFAFWSLRVFVFGGVLYDFYSPKHKWNFYVHLMNWTPAFIYFFLFYLTRMLTLLDSLRWLLTWLTAMLLEYKKFQHKESEAYPVSNVLRSKVI